MGQINTYNEQTLLNNDDSFIIQESGGTTKKIAASKIHESKVGFYDYHNTLTAQSLAGDGVWRQLNNNKLGAYTNFAYKPTSLSDAGIWNETTNQFDFSSLSLGDQILFRMDLSYTPGANNQSLNIRMELGIGASPYSLSMFSATPKDQYLLPNTMAYGMIYMGDTNTLNNPAEVQFMADSTSNVNVLVNGWYCNIIRR